MANEQACGVIRRRTTHIVEIEHLRKRTQNEYPVDAVATMSVLDAAGAPLANATDLPLAFVAGTVPAGDVYRGSIPFTVDLDLVTRCTVRVTVVQAGAQREFNIACPVIDG